jgi:predicted  nucleic acid-binding Zn-ribbon protein
MSDYDKEVLTASALLYRLDTIETDLSHVESDASDLGDLWCDSNTSINNRLDHIESEIEVMSQIITKNTLALDEIEKRIAIMQEKIDGID